MKNESHHKPSVLVLTSTFPRWEHDKEPAFVYELCRRLTADYDVTVLAPRSPGSKDYEEMSGLRVFRFPYFMRRWENLATHSGGILNRLRANPLNYLLVPIFLLGQLLALIRLLRHERFDLIHAHWLIPQGLISVLGIILSRRKIPLVCTSHGGDLFALQNGFFQRLKRWVMDSSAVLTVVSTAMKKMVVEMGVDREKVGVIPMGVDLRNKFIPDDNVKRNDTEILFVGRLVEKKGVRHLLEALPSVLDRYPNAWLTIAGAGPLEEDLRILAQRLDLREKIDFLGMVSQDQLPILYRRAVLAVFPFVVAESGDQEGFGLVQVEAMGCECPVIAGDLPAIHDSITNEESGLLVPSGNSELLADMIIRALNDSELCCRLAREGRKRVVEKFDWGVIAEKYVDLFKKMIR
ncbi:MAG TPA: glycosyltransferase [Paludibacter sp.]|nr:glycosyltransferase [Paludibacter sp.]HPM11535.1 glycosyltransferase [Paludibacter sp.]